MMVMNAMHDAKFENSGCYRPAHNDRLHGKSQIKIHILGGIVLGVLRCRSRP